MKNLSVELISNVAPTDENKILKTIKINKYFLLTEDRTSLNPRTEPK